MVYYELSKRSLELLNIRDDMKTSKRDNFAEPKVNLELSRQRNALYPASDEESFGPQPGFEPQATFEFGGEPTVTRSHSETVVRPLLKF